MRIRAEMVRKHKHSKDPDYEMELSPVGLGNM